MKLLAIIAEIAIVALLVPVLRESGKELRNWAKGE